MKTALIVIDMLDDFVTGALANPNAAAIVGNISCLAAKVHSEGGITIFANDAHLPGDPEEKVWGAHGLAGSDGARVLTELASEADFNIPKRFYGSFYETGLDQLLRQSGVTDVVLAGQHTNICVRHTAYEAFCRGYGITVADDCVAMFGEMSDYEYRRAQTEALDYLAMAYGARIVPGWQEV